MKAAACARSRVNNPFFARLWRVAVAHEAKPVRALRRENLSGLSGRVLEIGAGVGTNFACYPENVEQVIAVEPEPRLRARARVAAANAPVPVTVTGETMEQFSDAEPLGAGYCSRAGSRCSSPGNAWLAGWRMLIVTLRDSGVGSGLTSMTTVPRASARSGSPAAG